MLAALGDSYIADFVKCRLREEQEEKRWRQYLADGIYALTTGRELLRQFEFTPPERENGREENAEEIKTRILARLKEE